MPCVPQRLVDHAHAAWARRSAAAGLVRGDQYLRPLERHDAGVLEQVVVVANQDRRTAAVGQIEHRELTAAGDVFVDEGVQLSVAHRPPVRHRHDVTVEQLPRIADFEQTGAEAQVVLLGQAQKLLGRRSAWHRLGQFEQLVAAQVTQKPVAGDAHLREHHQLDALLRCLGGEAPHLVEIRLLVAGRMLELNGGNLDILHQKSAYLVKAGRERVDPVGNLAPRHRYLGLAVVGERLCGQAGARAWPTDAPARGEATLGALPNRVSSAAGRMLACSLPGKADRPVPHRLIPLMQRQAVIDLNRLHLCFQKIIHDRD